MNEIESHSEQAEVLSLAESDAKEKMGLSRTCASEEVPVTFTHAYSTDLASLPQARADLREACVPRHDVPLDSLALVASECLSNAIQYGERCSRERPLEVKLQVTQNLARLEVVNEGKPFKVLASTLPPPNAISGRGLYLVSKLADRWGEELTPQNRILVWSEFDLHRCSA